MNSPAGTAAPTGNSGKGQVSWAEIKHCQLLIERCLQRHMTQTEIITVLQVQAKIEPAFTCMVWNKLQQQNPVFFAGYEALLRLKDQITAFNYLVGQQTDLQRQLDDADDC